jgi:hypothetical protein
MYRKKLNGGEGEYGRRRRKRPEEGCKRGEEGDAARALKKRRKERGRMIEQNLYLSSDKVRL